MKYLFIFKKMEHKYFVLYKENQEFTYIENLVHRESTSRKNNEKSKLNQLHIMSSIFLPCISPFSWKFSPAHIVAKEGSAQSISQSSNSSFYL